MSKLLSFLFFFLISFAAIADDVFDLSKIEVSARKDISLFNFSSEVEFTQDELAGKNSPLVSTALENIPGVVANQNGGPGGRVSYFIRGTESRHVAFTLDGLKINDPSNTDRQFDAAFMSSTFLHSMTVHKGPQAVLFGSDALGGLIEMTTRKGDSAPETWLQLNGGSFGTYGATLAQDWHSHNSHQGTLNLQQFHSDGISRLNEKRFNATERDSTDTVQLTSSSRHPWTSRLDTEILAMYLQGKNELDGATDDNSHDESRNDHYVIQQKTDLKTDEKSAISLRNGLSRHSREADTLSEGIDGYDGNLIQNELLYRLDRGQANLLTGISTEHEDFNTADVGNSSDLHSAFLQSAIQLSALKFQAGIRTETHSRYGHFNTGSGGVSYNNGEGEYFFQYSQGFKAPSLYQLYAPPLFGFNIGNEELVPEVNHSLEGGWRWKDRKNQVSLTLFQNRLSNLITFTTSNGYVNQSRFMAEGVEVSETFIMDSFQLKGGFIHQNFKEEETTVLRRPLNSLMGQVSYFTSESWETFVRGTWNSSRKDLDENGDVVKLNSYEVFDLGVRYVKARFDYGVELKNILNRSYEDLYGYSVMPRSIFGHVGMKF